MEYGKIFSGWLCPRCGAVNAPWINQCNCHLVKTNCEGTGCPRQETVTITSDVKTKAPRSTEEILTMIENRI